MRWGFRMVNIIQYNNNNYYNYLRNRLPSKSVFGQTPNYKKYFKNSISRDMCVYEDLSSMKSHFIDFL